MSTGLVHNWADVDTLGAIYPFTGTEGLLAIICLVFWVGWHIWQIRDESAEFNHDVERIKARGGVSAVLEDELKREREDSVGG